jgi:sulfate adenylyltransferase
MTMSISLIDPHGGTLVDQLAGRAEAAELEAIAPALPRIELDPRELADIELIATGAASPLRGFLGSQDYASVLERMRLADGTVWSLPVTLAADPAFRPALEKSERAALYDRIGRLWAVMQVEDVFERDPLTEARCVYRTQSPSHPGVSYLLSRPRCLVGGPIRVLPLPSDLPFVDHRLSPRKLREQIASRGWGRVAAFQTRNPIHGAHEYLTKVALELVDGLVVHPLVGETKGDDVPAAVRLRAYQLLLEKYYPKERTLLAAFPAAMRYAGPREAIFHALIRKNYGVTHLIVGRDHAGVGQFYGPFEAQEIFEQFPAGELGIVALKFDAAFFCNSCGSFASSRTCPHPSEHRLELSGTKVREILQAGGHLPVEFTRPEIAALLRAHYFTSNSLPTNGANGHQIQVANGANGHEIQVANGAHIGRGKEIRIERRSARPGRGFILWFTGLSGAGKSTLARAIEAILSPRTQLEVLDGDEIRTYLSKGLGFSREDRDANIRRIGYLARLLARNGVAVLAAAISPYAETRDEVRELAARDGVRFLEVHVHAELGALIERDTKGLYRKALAGELAHFTGISDPYEAPTQPEVLIRSDLLTVEESVNSILVMLRKQGLVDPEAAGRVVQEVQQ